MPATAAGYNGGFASGSTTFSVPLTSPLVAGQRLIILASTEGNATLSTTSTGWTKLNQLSAGASSLATTLAAFTGVVGVASSTFTLSSTTTTVKVAYSISVNGADLSTLPVVAFAQASTGQADPPALTLPMSVDYCVIAFGTYGVGSYTPTGSPSGYSGPFKQQSGTAASAANLFFGIGAAAASLSSVNPGAFSGATSSQWIAGALAIPSAPVATRKRGSFHHLVGA